MSADEPIPTPLGDMIESDIRRQAMVDRHGEPPEAIQALGARLGEWALQRLADMVVDPTARAAFVAGRLELVVSGHPNWCEWREVDE